MQMRQAAWRSSQTLIWRGQLDWSQPLRNTSVATTGEECSKCNMMAVQRAASLDCNRGLDCKLRMQEGGAA